MLEYVLFLFIISAIFLTLLCCCTCISCLGLTSFITNIIFQRYHLLTYDRVYQADQPINKDCFICIEKVTHEVVATCNHSFCGECMATYIKSKDNQPINCPACRKNIVILYRRFDVHDQNTRNIKRVIAQYNCKHSTEPSFLRSVWEFGNTIRNLPLLFSRNGINFIFTNNRIKFILMMIIYTVSPVDFMPEAVLGPFGLLDDSIVMLNIFRQVSNLLQDFVRNQDRQIS